MEYMWRVEWNKLQSIVFIDSDMPFHGANNAATTKRQTTCITSYGNNRISVINNFKLRWLFPYLTQKYGTQIVIAVNELRYDQM